MKEFQGLEAECLGEKNLIFTDAVVKMILRIYFLTQYFP
jgi:hypothetical protein